VIGSHVVEEIPCGGSFPFHGAQPVDGKTDAKAAQHPQNMSGLGTSNPASVLIENLIEPVVQITFDFPVVAVQLSKCMGGEFMGRQAADHMDRLGAGFPILVFHHPGQPSDLRRTWEA
jgi:hypothetical protein